MRYGESRQPPCLTQAPLEEQQAEPAVYHGWWQKALDLPNCLQHKRDTIHRERAQARGRYLLSTSPPPCASWPSSSGHTTRAFT